MLLAFGDDPLVFHAPIDERGAWSAAVPPGRYLAIAQAMSGLDLQVRQQWIDVRGPVVVPVFAFDRDPQIVEVLVRSVSSTTVIGYVASPSTPLPRTWAALQTQLEEAPAMSSSELAPPRSDDLDTKVGDLVSRISAGAGILCALPDGETLLVRPRVLVDDADEAPACTRFAGDEGRVVISGR